MTTIAAERDRLVEVGLFLRRRERWGAVFNYTNARSVNNPATQAFCHISVTNPNAYASNDAHMRAIERIGINRFPATGISYNGAVLPGGILYEGQPWGRRGAHTVNDRRHVTCRQAGCPGHGSSLAAPSWNNNVTGRALVFARNINDLVTAADVEAAARYWAGYKLAGMLTLGARIHGHRCCASKDCPGGRVWTRMDDIADLTADYVRTGLPGQTPPPLPPPIEEEDDMASELFVSDDGRQRVTVGDSLFPVTPGEWANFVASKHKATKVGNTLMTNMEHALMAPVQAFDVEGEGGEVG